MDNTIKIENLYNEAIEYINNKNISLAIESLKDYLKINELDVDALNFLGICYFIKCEFNEAYKLFIKGNTIDKNNELSIKYINFLKSDKFNIILDLYNIGIENLQNENIDKSKESFEKILNLEPNLMEPKIILAIIYAYDKNIKLSNKLIDEVLEIDSENHHILFIKSIINKNKKNPNKIYKYLIAVSAGLMIFQGIYISNSDDKIEYKYNNTIESLSAENDLLKIKIKDLEDNKDISEENNIIIVDEKEAFKKAMKYFTNKEYEQAITLFDYLIKYGEEDLYVQESTYWIGSLYEILEDYDKAKLYYNKYIDNYSNLYNYYDDSLYKLGLLYYSSDDIENSQKIMNKLENECSESIYNNSKVKEIINY